MQQLKIQTLTPEGFQKYGEYQNLLDDASLAKKSVIPAGFYADVLYMDWGGHTPPTISVCPANQEEKMIISFIDAHRYTHEGLLPLDGDVVIYVGVPGMEGIESETAAGMECFMVPRGTYVKLYPQIRHGRQFSLEDKPVHVLCQLPARTFANDMIFTMIKDPQNQGEIIR
mgnify:FL=1